MTTVNEIKTVKRTFWGAAAFYFLIAFEFCYMASPFAIYFYSVYRPILNFFNDSPLLSGLITYFMPHFTTTSSSLINAHNIVGGILAVLGFLGFCIGACQVYYHKLARKGAVTGGIYNFIRHPQYACFIICSFGLLLLWPRYIVLIMFVTMLFAYYLLAKAEEKECEEKFGQSYIDYKNKTGMFFPVKLPKAAKLTAMPKSRRFALSFGIYLITLAVSVSIAIGLNNLTLDSLYTVYQDNSVNLSISAIEQSKLERIINTALSDKEVNARIEKTGVNPQTKFLNYVLPSDWYAAEIPMNGVLYRAGHRMPADYDRNSYKIIFTKADIRGNKEISSREILQNITGREPIIEVWVNV
ncbi:MAG: hypothetical protein N2484_19055, partial [Clostridia bacterium]|nr:hypothetical protein [Clostridia bacterium]